MTTTIGYDVGGAHLKIARIENGRPVAVRQIVCPLWQGIDKLDAALEEHLAEGWEYDVEVVISAPLSSVLLPRTLGRLESVDDTTTRLVGSTSNPRMYAEELTRLSSPFTVVRGPELQAAVRGSSYSNFGGTVNYKLGGRYRPVRDVTLRGSYEELAHAFQKLVDDYVESRYGRKDSTATVTQ